MLMQTTSLLGLFSSLGRAHELGGVVGVILAVALLSGLLYLWHSYRERKRAEEMYQRYKDRMGGR